MSKLSIATLLGKKNVYVSCAIMNMDEIRIGQNVLKPYQSVVSLEILLMSDATVKLTIDHTRVYFFDSKSKATSWLKKEFKPITDLSRLIIHVSQTLQSMKYANRFNAEWAIQEVAEGAISPRKNKVMRVHFSESSYYEVSQSKVIAGMYDVLYVSTRSSLVKWLYRYTYEGITDWLFRYGYIGDNFELADAIERGDIYRP